MAPSRMAGNLRSSATTLSGSDLAGAQIAVAADVVVGVVELEVELLRGGVQDLDGFADHFRAGAVAADDCNIVAFHV